MLSAGFAGPYADITGATPNSWTQSRRHYGGPLVDAPRANDGRHVPAGLLARGSGASHHLPAVLRQWLLGRRSPLTVAGAAAALRRNLAPRSLFTRRGRLDPGETVTREDRSKIAHVCQLKACRRLRLSNAGGPECNVHPSSGAASPDIPAWTGGRSAGLRRRAAGPLPDAPACRWWTGR